MNEKTIANTSFRMVHSISGRGGQAHQFSQALRGLAIDDQDRIYAVGDRSVKIFSAMGELLHQWPTERPGYSVAVDRRGHVWVGQDQQVEIFALPDAPTVWRDEPRLGLVTAIAFGAADVFLADAKARCIHRYDFEGHFLNDIGDQHRKGGFHIPNGVVDFAIDDQGVLHVANPGMHRVERYEADGQLLGHFGRFDGRDPQGFPGCCNPTNLAIDGAGRVIVTEKAGPRAKVYDEGGRLLALVADDGFDPAAKNMDVVVDSRGRIYVADTAALTIRTFAPISREVTP